MLEPRTVTMFSFLVILVVGIEVIWADTQVIDSFPIQPSTIIQDDPIATNSIYTDRFQNFYDDVDDNILASPTDDLARYVHMKTIFLRLLLFIP